MQSLAHADILRLEEIARAVRIASDLGITHVRLTGGEPLVRRGCVDLARELAANPRIEDLSLTTNGILLPQFAAALKEAGVQRLNISLDTLDPIAYARVTRLGRLEDALAGIEAGLEQGFCPIKLNAVAVRSLHQDFCAFAKLTIAHPLHVRFIEYMPVGQGCWGEEDVIPAGEILEEIRRRACEEGLPEPVPACAKEVPEGVGPARYYKIPGAQGTIGFISALSHHFCASCNRLRLTADGRLRPCLFSDAEYDIKDALRHGTDVDVAAVFERAIREKPDAKHDKKGTVRKMSQIGG